jgi:hypothetical protein
MLAPDQMPPSDLLQTMLVAVGTSLAAAVTYLFKLVMDLSRSQARQAKEIGELRGQQDGIRHLSQEVLETVRKAVQSPND